MTATSCSRSRLEQLQGQTEGVVQIAGGLEHVEARGEDLRDGFLGGGLSGGACDSDDAATPLAADGVGELLQCVEDAVVAVGDAQEAGFVDLGGDDPEIADYGGDCAVGQRCLHEVVAVEALALDGEEEFACGDGARVDRVAERFG